MFKPEVGGSWGASGGGAAAAVADLSFKPAGKGRRRERGLGMEVGGALHVVNSVFTGSWKAPGFNP